MAENWGMIIGDSIHIYKKSPDRRPGGQIVFKDEPLISVNLFKCRLKKDSDRLFLKYLKKWISKKITKNITKKMYKMYKKDFWQITSSYFF